MQNPTPNILYLTDQFLINHRKGPSNQSPISIRKSLATKNLIANHQSLLIQNPKANRSIIHNPIASHQGLVIQNPMLNPLYLTSLFLISNRQGLVIQNPMLNPLYPASLFHIRHRQGLTIQNPMLNPLYITSLFHIRHRQGLAIQNPMLNLLYPASLFLISNRQGPGNQKHIPDHHNLSVLTIRPLPICITQTMNRNIQDNPINKTAA